MISAPTTETGWWAVRTAAMSSEVVALVCFLVELGVLALGLIAVWRESSVRDVAEREG